MTFTYTADGILLLSGSADLTSSAFTYLSSGNATISDSAVAVNVCTFIASGSITVNSSSAYYDSAYSFLGSGTATISGAAVIVLRRTFIASGNTLLSGLSTTIQRNVYVSSGSVYVDNLASALCDFSISFGFTYLYDVYGNFEFSQSFEYDVGELPLRTFRVVGVEYYNCDNIPFCAIPNGLNRMFQEIIARNLSEVCQFLSDVNWTWPIADIQRSIHPVESFIAVDSTGIAINGLPVPLSNEFVSVPFSQIPECIPFTVAVTSTTSMGIETNVIELQYFAATGGISITGNVDLSLIYTSNGNLNVGGSAISLCASYIYEMSGNIVLSDTALLSLSNYDYESSGNISISGESVPISPYQKYVTSGEVFVFDTAINLYKISYIASGLSDTYPIYAGIIVSGDAIYPIKPYASGFVYISGESVTSRKIYRYEASGFAYLSGVFLVIAPNQKYVAAGNVLIDGSTVVNVASFEIVVDDTIPILLGESATTRDSLSGDFWYTSLLSSVSLGGSADYLIPGFAFESNGEILLSGSYDSSLSIDDVSMGIFSEIDFLEVAFNEEFASNIIPVAQNIAVVCPDCNPIPDTLYLRCNLSNGNILNDFLLRNKFKIPDSIQLSYNRITESWQNSLHLNGIGSDNSNVQELWHINFEWACTSQYGENELSSGMWKFSMYIKRINLTTGKDNDTRLFVLFPSTDLCSNFNNLGVDFTFDFHFRPQYVTNDLDINVDTLNYYDEANVFKGAFWDANSFVCRILDRNIDLNVNTIDISSLRPESKSQFYV